MMRYVGFGKVALDGLTAKRCHQFTTSASASSRIVSVRGVDFHVEMRPSLANKPVLLCLAGALGTARTDFGPFLDEGLGDYSLVALDPRGLGKSKSPSTKRDYPLDFYIRDALDAHAVMAELGYHRYSILGWSDGAIAAFHMASMDQTKRAVDKLVVWGGQAFITKQDMSTWNSFRDVRKTWSARMLQERANIVGGIDELQRMNHQVTDAYQELYDRRGGDICLDCLHKIECPSLIIHGEKDAVCDLNHAKYIARQIPAASLKLLPEGKHNLHIRHKETFDNLVSEFIDKGQGEIDAVDTDPNIEDIAYAFMSSKALFAGIRAGVFDAINAACTHSQSKTTSFDQIERRSLVKGERLQTLLSSCVAINLIHRRVVNGEDVFRLPKASREQLCRDSRRYWGDYISGQVDAQFYRRMADLDETLVTGNASQHGYEEWFDKDPEAARRYTEAQHNGSLATGFALWKRLPELVEQIPDMKVLDVGGGSGAFSIATARKLPQATAVVLDLPNVVLVAEDIIEREDPSVKERLSTVTLSATDPGKWKDVVDDESFDVVIMSYVSGSIPVVALSGLYANAFRALKPGGTAIVHDFFVDNNGRGPRNSALWALAHVTVNPDGMGLRPHRLVHMLCDEGFIAPRVDDLISGATQIIVAKKPYSTE